MSNDAIVLLREDHKEVRGLFREYRARAQDGDDQARAGTVGRIIESLTVHTYLEDELVYPRIRREVEGLAEEMDRAKEEHHVADLLCEELSRMSPGDEATTPRPPS
ncbi:hemerythrin domain-containing protein [Kitasatospora sp. NPDC127059]|uniref:hemerythrin domain-containing protein n=1 Tax=unclassified Kitasatospora TaxID=2633591 RepID=UPI0036464A47